MIAGAHSKFAPGAFEAKTLSEFDVNVLSGNALMAGGSWMSACLSLCLLL